MNVGDVVIPNAQARSFGRMFHCGSGIYTHAIVGSIEPFILVSDDGSMLWSVTWEPDEVTVLCQASEAIQEAVRKRVEAHQSTEPEEVPESG